MKRLTRKLSAERETELIERLRLRERNSLKVLSRDFGFHYEGLRRVVWRARMEGMLL